MRYIIIRVLLGSIHSMYAQCVYWAEILFQFKQMMLVKALISPEDVESIFYKIPELQAIHKEFANFLEGELNMFREEQFIGEAFKNLVRGQFYIL